MMKLLITGSAGFVGRNLAEHFLGKSELHLADIVENNMGVEAPWHPLDITDPGSVQDVFDKARPDVVIHAAANKNVKWCEANPELARAINSEGTGNIASACQKSGAWMVYVSTDLVFSCQEGGYTESDVPVPGTVYGRTKLEGERAAATYTSGLSVCRSGGIYGKYSPLLAWLQKELQEGRRVNCYTDVYNTPTYAVNFAEMVEKVIVKRLAGTWHTVGASRVNRLELFQAFAQTFGYDVSLLVPDHADRSAPEVMLLPDSSLSAQRSNRVIGVHVDSVREGMGRLLATGGLE